MLRKGELYYLPTSPNTIGVIKLGTVRCEVGYVASMGVTECTQTFGWEVCMGRATRKTWCTWHYDISTDLK
jgi:hypothetical protein